MSALPCINCRHYARRDSALNDICMHPQAIYGGIRGEEGGHLHCFSMRIGFCHDANLYEPMERGGDDEADQLRTEERAENDRAREMAREP